MREYKDDFIELENEAYKGSVTYDDKGKIVIQLPLEPQDFETLLGFYNTEISINSQGLYRDKIKIDKVKVHDVRYNWSKEKGYEIIFDCEAVKDTSKLEKAKTIKKVA